MTTRKEKNLAQALNQQRESRIARLVEAGRIRSAAEIPEDALPAALELQNPQGTYFPPLFYRDISFHCKDCRKHQVWSATQQRWYYEIAKGPVQATAKRCRACRKKHKDETLRQRELLRLHRFYHAQELRGAAPAAEPLPSESAGATPRKAPEALTR